MFYPTKQHFHEQTGTAIVMALFVVAIVSAIATVMLSRIQQDTRRAELIINAAQAYQYAQGSLAWAQATLIENSKKRPVTDNTPIVSPISKVHNAIVQSTIIDAQSFFNLNNLAEPNSAESFNKLIKLVMPKLEDKVITSLTAAIIDWISTHSQSEIYNEYYAKLNPPYRSPHQLMASQSELRLVKGMTPEIYENLTHYVITLPITTPINIKNASAPVLITLSPKLTPESLQMLSNILEKTPPTSLQNFLELDIVKNNAIPEDKITFTSDYFLIKTHVTIGDQITTLYTLMQRSVENSKTTVTTLWQSKGTL